MRCIAGPQLGRATAEWNLSISLILQWKQLSYAKSVYTKDPQEKKRKYAKIAVWELKTSTGALCHFILLGYMYTHNKVEWRYRYDHQDVSI